MMRTKLYQTVRSATMWPWFSGFLDGALVGRVVRLKCLRKDGFRTETVFPRGPMLVQEDEGT